MVVFKHSTIQMRCGTRKRDRCCRNCELVFINLTRTSTDFFPRSSKSSIVRVLPLLYVILALDSTFLIDFRCFQIKGAGHAVNPGFSSTPGVHISMARFSEVKYQASSQTAEVGTGLIWDDVYAALEPYNRTVVGGRVSGVGVAGLSLGGGMYVDIFGVQCTTLTCCLFLRLFMEDQSTWTHSRHN